MFKRNFRSKRLNYINPNVHWPEGWILSFDCLPGPFKIQTSCISIIISKIKRTVVCYVPDHYGTKFSTGIICHSRFRNPNIGTSFLIPGSRAETYTL